MNAISYSNSLDNASIDNASIANASNNSFETLSIEGNIGSGKSTLLENLRTHYENNPNVIFLKEPVDEWATIQDENGVTMLEKFYKDQTKYSFAFQMMAYISRLNNLKKTVEMIRQTQSSSNKTKKIIITERSLYTDKMVFAQMLYDSGKMESIEFQVYLKWFDSFIEEFPVSKIIYVKTNPEICHFRITKRSREGESIIPLEYLDNCDVYHEKMLSTTSICKSQLVLDGNTNIYDNQSELKNWILKIEEFLLE
jgi:deoxyadenosine/deoxycytidine kinase